MMLVLCRDDSPAGKAVYVNPEGVRFIKPTSDDKTAIYFSADHYITVMGDVSTVAKKLASNEPGVS